MKSIILTDKTIYRAISLIRSAMSSEEALEDGLLHTLLCAYHDRTGRPISEKRLCPVHGWVIVSHTCGEVDGIAGMCSQVDDCDCSCHCGGFDGNGVCKQPCDECTCS